MMIELSMPDLLIFCGSTIVIMMLLMELLDWSCIATALDCPSKTSAAMPDVFLYGEKLGPAVWRCTFPEAAGCEQSPINILSRKATVIVRPEPLVWCGYSDEPLSMTLANDGNTVVLLPCYPSGLQPKLLGGPLSGGYDFRSVAFRWGPGNDEGSEHSIDFLCFPLELQVTHKKLLSCQPAAAPRDMLAVVSYVFELTNADNPYLDHVVTNLWRIRRPGTSVQVPPFPLEWLFPTFNQKYYSYNGSLTMPPCSEIAVWLVQPEPISISSNQLAEFRKIHSVEGPILSNSRPVQLLNDREIFYYG